METLRFRQVIFNEDGSFQRFHYWGYRSPGVFHGPITCLHNAVIGGSDRWTGLKDVRGNGVYETDFVFVNVYSSRQPRRPCMVTWFKSPVHIGFDLDPLSSEGEPCGNRPWSDIVVFGNRWENGEDFDVTATSKKETCC